MDCIFDWNNKNWPTQGLAQIWGNKIIVNLGEFGFKTLTEGNRGVGKAIVSGHHYVVELPGEVVDGTKWIVSFKRIDG